MAKIVQLKQDSILKDTELLDAGSSYGTPYKDKAFFELWERPKEFRDLSDDAVSIHTVRSHQIGRLDLIAYEYYGAASLWPVIAAANDLVDIIEDMFPGQRLIIPSVEIVTAFRRRRESGVIQSS